MLNDETAKARQRKVTRRGKNGIFQFLPATPWDAKTDKRTRGRDGGK
jgi:hypothetical protein